jgi:hypothetical protein
MDRIITAPFIVVKSGDTGPYSLMFSLENERIELMRAISKQAFEAKLIEVFKTMDRHVLPNQGPQV